MGKVIGKQGRIAKAIRSVVKAAHLARKKSYRRDRTVKGDKGHGVNYVPFLKGRTWKNFYR